MLLAGATAAFRGWAAEAMSTDIGVMVPLTRTFCSGDAAEPPAAGSPCPRVRRERGVPTVVRGNEIPALLVVGDETVGDVTGAVVAEGPEGLPAAGPLP